MLWYSIQTAVGSTFSGGVDGTLSVIDMTSNEITAVITVGKWLDGLAVDPASGRVYVADSLGRALSVMIPK